MKPTQPLSVLAIAVSMLVIGCSESSPVTAPVGDISAIALPTAPQDADVATSSRGSLLNGALLSTSADPLASGNAKWERRADRMKFSAEVEDVRTSGAHEVRINGKRAGDVRVAGGIGDLNLDTRSGHRVPEMRSGDLVEVFNPAGLLILKGTVR